MVPFFGYSLMLLAAFCAAFSVVSTFVAYRVAEPLRSTWLSMAYRATLCTWVVFTASCATLVYLFLADDFSVAYVVEHSSISQGTQFKISAFWGGQGGSLMLWSWILTCYAALVAVRGRKGDVYLAPTAVAVVNVVSVFFITLVAFTASPFALIQGAIPKDGQGLNPLLQNYWMQIHPPTLYTGYVGCTIPFAYAIAALLHRRYDASWLAVVRRWTLFPWVILTIGIIMGGRWAYETLGWGGYWAWDPVENASLLPWLTGTAFLHSLMIQTRRGMLKNWNMVLVTLTFLLSIFGTFLTRSGVIQSIHAFAESNIGPYFLAFLAFVLVVSFAIVIWRRDDLVPETEFESPLSREGAFLLNNWILLGAAFAVLWGTVYPSIAEAVIGTTVSVGKPYFNRIMIPLGLILLALTGIGPLMAWRKMSVARLASALKMPIACGIAAIPVFYLLSRWHTGAASAVCLGVFVSAAIIGEFGRGYRARKTMTGERGLRCFGNLLMKNRQRYGGYIVHLGIVMIFVGFAGQAFNIVTEPIQMKPGDTLKLGEFNLVYMGLQTNSDIAANKERQIAARMDLFDGKKPLRNLDGSPVSMFPAIAFYKPVGAPPPGEHQNQMEGQEAGVPDILTRPWADIYVILSQFDEKTQTATVKAYLNPLVMWVWTSALFFIGGTALSLLPEPRRLRVAQEQRATGPNTAGSMPVVTAAVAGEGSR